MRKPIIAGNWKMNMSIAEAIAFIAAIKDNVDGIEVEPIICAPYTLLKDLKVAMKNSAVRVGAQNMHYEENGAFTGEISPLMLKELGVEYVIIGHSERRQYFNEIDETVNRKVLMALKHDLRPIVCCGETLEQREAGDMESVVKEQIEKGLASLPEKSLKDIVIAYEPIWAIGTGKVATFTQANDAIKFIRSVVAGMFGEENALKVRIQYGGSVTPENVSELMGQSDIDGALVGGASLKPENFLGLVNYLLR